MRLLVAISVSIVGGSLAFAQSAPELAPSAALGTAAPKTDAMAQARQRTRAARQARPAAPQPAAAAATAQQPAAARPAPARAANARPARPARAAARTRPGQAAAKPALASAPTNGTTGNAPAAGNASTTANTPAAAGPNLESLRTSFMALPLDERVAIQSDLIWTNDYNGLLTGEFSERLTEAVKAFQKRQNSKPTGLLTPQERTALSAASRPKRTEVGWRLVEDPTTGGRVGLPGAFATQSGPGATGTIWSSAQGQLRVETFRITTGATLEGVFEQQKKEPPGRRVGYNVLRPDVFVISGTQGLKKFYVRAFGKNNEIRGITILYDQAMEGSMDPIVVAMASAFTPFAAGENVPSPAGLRRKVEYGSGIVVSAAGHIVTDRQLADGCQVIVIPGVGNADRLAEDPASGLALLRIYGVQKLNPISLLGESPIGNELTLVGIADPQAQGGRSAVSTVRARLGAEVEPRPLEAAPAQGFSGAAAIDGGGRFAGMVVLRSAVVAGPAGTAPTALVPRDKVINFLEANYVAPASGRPGLDDARAALTRVICVRK